MYVPMKNVQGSVPGWGKPTFLHLRCQLLAESLNHRAAAHVLVQGVFHSSEYSAFL